MGALNKLFTTNAFPISGQERIVAKVPAHVSTLLRVASVMILITRYYIIPVQISVVLEASVVSEV